MILRDSRNLSRAVAGLTGWAQYSIPVPSGNATSSRPPDSTSSMAYSSARRLGSMRLGGVPHTQIRAFVVCGTRAAAMRLGAAIML